MILSAFHSKKLYNFNFLLDGWTLIYIFQYIFWDMFATVVYLNLSVNLNKVNGGLGPFSICDFSSAKKNAVQKYVIFCYHTNEFDKDEKYIIV